MPATPSPYMTICNELSLDSDHKLIRFNFHPSAIWENIFWYFLNSSILFPESYSASSKPPPTQMKTINNINGSMSAIIYTTPDSSIGRWSLNIKLLQSQWILDRWDPQSSGSSRVLLSQVEKSYRRLQKRNGGSITSEHEPRWNDWCTYGDNSYDMGSVIMWR